MRYSYSFLLGIVLLFSATLSSAEPLKATGTWQAPGREGTWEGTFQAAGNDLVGEMTITNFPDVTGGQIAGSISEAAINFGLVYSLERERVSFAGTTDRRTLQGTFDSEALSGDC